MLTRNPDAPARPSCSRTGEGSSGRPVHGDPAPIANPRSSSAIAKVAGSRSSNVKQTRWGTRWVGWPQTVAPGTSASRSRSSAVADHMRAASSAIVARAASQRRRHPRDPGRVLHPRAPLALAVVAARVGRDPHPAPDVEGPHARRPAELVPRQREQVDVERLHVDRQPAHGLAGVGVEADPGLTAEARGLADLLHRPDLVVRVLDAREEGRGGAHLRGEAIEVDAPVDVGRDDHDLEPVALEDVADAAHGRVLDRGHDDPRPELALRADPAPDRERHRLGAAGREHDLVGLRAEGGGDPRAPVLELLARGAAGPMHGHRVARPREGVDHRLGRLGAQRRRRRGVEEDVGGHGVAQGVAGSRSRRNR